MTDRLAAAQAALNSGRSDEAIEHLIAAVAEEPARPLPVYRVLVVNLYQAGRFEEGEIYAAKGLERSPKDYELLNTRGVLLRKLRRFPEAAKVLEAAIKVNPKNLAAHQNLGNVLLDLNEGAKAEAVFTRLVRLEPRNPEYLRQLGRSLVRQGRIEPALSRLRQAVAIRRDHVDTWLDLVGTLNEENRAAEAEEVLDKAIAANPGAPRLLEGKVMVLRRSGQVARARQFMEDILPANPEAGWLHQQLGALLADYDRPRANALLRRSVELEPTRLDYAATMIENLERTRVGDEGGHIEESYHLAKALLHRRAEFNEAATKIFTEVFVRTCDYDSLDLIGDFKTLGRSWATTGRHSALLKQLGRIESDEDRIELVEQHRMWGRDVENYAARRPINRPEPRPRGDKIRLGFMSSDLRQHPVGYFALPLFDHVDHDRFEVYVYSYFTGAEDAAQRLITSKVTAYRWWPEVSVPQAAERIAADQLDILIELGGSTHMNKLDVMAYKPAPIQASWLGYPHSAGLSTIDYFVCDPYSLPANPDYLIEKPLVMPKTWLALGRAFFSDTNQLTPGLPSERKGHITFGTANNPHKYSRQVLRTWAKVLKAIPDSRFLIIRPEGSGATFRNNIRAQFELEGVASDRVDFQAVRGAHLPFYNELDISLDPFPLTGGTTTTESLWMGVPLVNLRGKMFHERLSYSILSNAGLGDLSTDNLDDYQAKAVELAHDTDRRRDLRATLRERLRNSPLGQTEQFAKDFYDMIYKAVTERS